MLKALFDYFDFLMTEQIELVVSVSAKCNILFIIVIDFI